MVMAPGGNLGGDEPFYPAFDNPGALTKLTLAGNVGLTTAWTTLFSTALPPGIYLVIAVAQALAVTAADQILLSIGTRTTPLLNDKNSYQSEELVSLVTGGTVQAIGVIQISSAAAAVGTPIVVNARGAATSNITVQATDVAGVNFFATYANIIKIR